MAEQPSFHVVADDPKPGFFSNVVAIIGLIILIVVVIWGLLHLASLSKGWFANVFNKSSTPSLTISAPENINSGDTFTLSWKHSTEEKGNYALLYRCVPGLKMQINEASTIPCGATFTVGAVRSQTLSATLSGTSSAAVPISVVFLPSATSSKSVQASTNIVVHVPSFGKKPQTTTNTANTSPVATRTQTSVQTTASNPTPRTPADIAVRIIALGVIDSTTGQFVNRAPINQYEIAAAQFDITNIGGSASGVYYFSAVLPTALPYTYESAAQNPLNAGDHVINTLRWTQASQGGQFSVTVTGGPDVDEYNNFASRWFGGAAYYPEQQPTYYVPQQPIYYPQYQY